MSKARVGPAFLRIGGYTKQAKMEKKMLEALIDGVKESISIAVEYSLNGKKVVILIWPKHFGVLGPHFDPSENKRLTNHKIRG